MKKKNLFTHLIISILFLMLFVTLKTYALDYIITFTGTGASTTVESVIVQNLTKGTTVTVPGGNVLNLNDAPNAVEQLNADDHFIRIYPNLIEGKSTVSFFAKQAGSTQLNAFSIDGRKIAGITENLQTGINSFQLSFPKGSFVIQVVGNGYTYTAKMINQTGKQSKPEITYIGTVKPATSAPQKSKSSAPGTTTMTYATGDQLLYKAVSGNYSTIVTDVPTGSKNMNFNFVACQDADGNNYSVVTIGTQTWMVENLKTTKYKDGTAIPLIVDNTAWLALSTPAYCWYNYDAAIYKNTYGALYNWYSVNTGKLAPTGWHVPTDAEWTTLENYVSANFGTSGSVAKALAATTNWTTDYSVGAIGNDLTKNNNSGFSALPGGFRSAHDANFFGVGGGGEWWSSTQDNTYLAWVRSLYYSNSYVGRYNLNMWHGFSVRCVKGDIPVLSTTTASTITSTSAISGGNVTSDGNATVTARGVCWNTSGNPTIADNKTIDGSGSGTFVSNLSNLASGTTYYLRAYATNSFGTGYGSQVSFITADFIPPGVYLARKTVIGYPKYPQTVADAKLLPTAVIDGATNTDPTVVELPYAQTLDLVNEVIAMYNGSAFDVTKYGLKFKFDLLDESGNVIVYKIGSNQTDQQQFIQINDAAQGSITFSQPINDAAQGCTPIVRVTMYNDQQPTYSVLMSFIKIHLADKPIPVPISVAFSFTDQFVACSDVTGALTSQQMIDQIYSRLGLSMTDFNSIYYLSYSGEGVITQNSSTSTLNWTLTSNQIWSKLMYYTNPATFTATAVYNSALPTFYPNVVINFSRKFYEPFLNLTSTISNFWYTNTAVSPLPYVKHNVYIPDVNESTTTRCLFQNNINEAFEQNTDKSLKGLSNYQYYFYPIQPTLAGSNGNVTLSPSADGQTLLNGSEVVATINPRVSNVGDVLILNQISATAKNLLNKDVENMKARIGIRTVYCSSLPQFRMPVTVNGNPYFDVVFVRPINPQPFGGQHFADALNFGDQYTYLEIAKLTDLNDWRFSDPVASFATHFNYWSYYGVTNITVDIPNIKTDLNQAAGVMVPLSQNPDLRVAYALTIPGVTNPTATSPNTFFGYLTYNNTGSTIGKPFNLYVPVTITYSWGSIQSAVVAVPVWNNVGISGVKRK